MENRLKTLAALVTTAVVLVIAGGIARFTQPQSQSQTPDPNQDEGAVETVASITLSSQPFPLTVGPSSLSVLLTSGDNAPIEDAIITVNARMKNPGMVPLSRSVKSDASGAYTVAMMWPMTGQWIIDVLAQLPDGDAQIQDTFEVYIFQVPPQNFSTRTTYIGANEYKSLAADPERELWVIIPQGTGTLVASGHGDDLIPYNIRLSLTGQRTLVIRNDDIVDHTIGPFFVRAGETVRQTFNQPAVYKGACSVSHDGEVNIIVEG